MNLMVQNGVLNIFKEKDYTSHDVIARLRGILKTKKIGHTGTLDPDAEGVLPVCIGKATKISDFITERDKSYQAILKLGMTTDTQDFTGDILSTSVVNVSKEELFDITHKYIGSYEQLPPMYSAIRIGGVKLYHLARQGVEIERPTRRVFINNIEILYFDEENSEALLNVQCEKGTYIRTLLHDIGSDLGCGGTTKNLVRTRVGNLNIENALKLSEVEDLVKSNEINQYVIPMDQMLSHYPKLKVKEEYNVTIQNGNPLSKSSFDNINELKDEEYKDLIRIYDYHNNFIALYYYKEDRKLFVPKKMLI